MDRLRAISSSLMTIESVLTKKRASIARDSNLFGTVQKLIIEYPYFPTPERLQGPSPAAEFRSLKPSLDALASQR